MTGRERLLKAFAGEPVDRVPVYLFLIDQGEFISQLHPDIDPWDCLANQMKILEFSREMGADVFLRLVFIVDDPEWVHLGGYGGLNVARSAENWEVSRREVRVGETVKYQTTIRTPDGELSQEVSLTEPRPRTLLYACTKKPIRSPEDLEIAAKYEPGFPEEWKPKAAEKVRTLKGAMGDDGVLGIWLQAGVFNNAALLVDNDRLYTMFLTEPDFYKNLMDFCLRRGKNYSRVAMDAGSDVHLVSGNIPGGFLGRRCYDEHILQYEKACIDFLQADGRPAIYHNCGQIMTLLESYKRLGARMVEPFTPPPLGDADLAEARRIVNGEYITIGGVDQINVIKNGTADDVKRVTARTMQIGKPGGKFLLQNADFFDYGTPVENIRAFVETGLEHATY
jgi:uroporphyrinogen decarboxylase